MLGGHIRRVSSLTPPSPTCCNVVALTWFADLRNLFPKNGNCMHPIRCNFEIWGGARGARSDIRRESHIMISLAKFIPSTVVVLGESTRY